ncbi:MAG: carboxypeptidase regulatory-like domain-containing protein [Candidatus Eisenbacteria bacterium]|nr:carboxypeptidase regulatory-like domain-containing protein [Candidatus Eisenbacteria bacterium]
MRRSAHLAFFCLLLTVFPALRTESMQPEPARDAVPTVEVTEESEGVLRLLFEMPLLSEIELEIDGERFRSFSVPGGGFEGEIGGPATPIFTRLIAVPEGARIEARAIVLSEETREGILLAPLQRGDESRESAFDYDEEAYAVRGADSPSASVGETARIRGLRVAPVTFRPVRYDPATRTLRVADRIEVEIVFDGGASKASAADIRPMPPSFDLLLSEAVANYSSPDKSRALPGGHLMICPNNAALVDSLQRLLDWKERKGEPVTLVTTAVTGTTTGAIKSYIQSVYNDDSFNLEYVTLVGDVSGTYAIPCWYETSSGYGGEGDHGYTLLDGTDILADVHIGRLSVSSADEVSRVISKIVNYESAPEMGSTSWFTRACVVGDPSSSGESCVETGRWLADRLLDLGYDDIDTIYTENFVSQMSASITQGCSVHGYRGWYYTSGWGTSNIYTLNNGYKLPYVVMLTCDTGSFAGGTSRSEAWLRAGSGTTTMKGGIGAVGTATIHTHTRYNNCMYYGIWRGILWDGPATMGASLTRGKLEIYNNYYDNEADVAETWAYWNNLMGDPSLDVWTAVPQTLTVTHDASVALGANSIVVEVAAGGTPVRDALVCVRKGSETYERGRTDASGRIELPLNNSSGGAMQITVTKHNHHPYLADVTVDAGGDHLGYLAHTVDDDASGDSQGNGDGNVNAGEAIELPVQLRNYSGATKTSVTAELTSDDPFVTILDGNETWGDIGGGGDDWSDEDFDFQIAPGCPQGHLVQLGLDVSSGASSWHSLIEIPVVSSALETYAVIVVDGGNSRLDPGETANLVVRIENTGESYASNVTGTLSSLSSMVTVGDASGSFGGIDVGAVGICDTDYFTVTADASTYQGYLANFEIVCAFSGGRIDTVPFSITVGAVATSDPTGPDGYGYYAFDDTDAGYPEAPVYSWVELDPSYGGDGTEIVLGDNGTYQDKSVVIALPFPFQYYGESYDTITVCSNGWISMGRSPSVAYRNWIIPGSGGPNGMIAPFWDDLDQSGGGAVYRKYDAANNRYIIEWSRMEQCDWGTDETFELILYDPAHHTTDTNDGIIVFQYYDVNQYDAYPYNGYATVGIENLDQSDGLLYSYYNKYSSGSSILADGRAIRFVPVAAGPTGTLTGDVFNASNGNTPIQGVQVRLVESGRSFSSGSDGKYGGMVTPGVYTAVATHASFDPDTVENVTITEAQNTDIDFYLIDVVAPVLGVTAHASTDDETGPYTIPVTIAEYSDLAQKTLYYRTNWNGNATPLELQYLTGDSYEADIPGQPYSTIVEYWAYARDAVGLESVDPAGAPAEVYRFVVAPEITLLDEEFESAGDWTVGDVDDDAASGIWVREAPVGTEYNGETVQPYTDHTIDPGEICFVTGNADSGQSAGTADVDGGKTTLFSPVFDLSDYMTASVAYWVWYTNDRGLNPGGDIWKVSVNDGSGWTDLEYTSASTNAWVQRNFVLEEHIDLTSTVQFRFVASDDGSGSLVEAAVDDFRLFGYVDVMTGVSEGPAPEARRFGLEPCRPNPFNPTTTIGYSLAAPGSVKITIHDVSGRLVRTLVNGPETAGTHHAVWNGRNDEGMGVASGVYFSRLVAGGDRETRKMVLIR